MKDHGFAGVTLPGDIADDVIAILEARAEKTGREDLDSLVDHMRRARSRYGTVPVALEGSDEAKNISAELEERFHGGQVDVGKGSLENYGDPERDYAHPKTPLFFGWLRSRGEDPSNKMVAVAEIASLIARGDYAEAGVSEEDAMAWLDHHFATVHEVNGPQSLEQLERFIRGAAAQLVSKEITVKDEKEQFVEDYTKVAMAHFAAPAGKKREAMKKALQEVWDRRRREKEAKQKQAQKK